MRNQGRLEDWNDDKGFGFVTPDAGGLRVFVHIKSFSDRTRRPRNGDVITWQVGWDKSGRPRAQNVLFRAAGLASAAPARTRSSAAPAILLAFLFVSAVIALAACGKLPFVIPLVYVVSSLVAFLLYAFDKSAAMNRRRRTRENTLHVISLLGGWPGALIAQRLFHHKSAKRPFQLVFWFGVLVHLTALAWVIFRPTS
jgi:uncharacterized membrane protein YsdA (DUF1294 family)/cold shock CspA family protein